MPPLNSSHEPSDASSSKIEAKEEISEECRQCINYLKNALNQPGKTQSLLRALGAVNPSISDATTDEKSGHGSTDASNNSPETDMQNKRRIYQSTPDGRGVVLHLNSEVAINSPVLMSKIQPRVSLQKRLTNAASRMMYRANPNNSANDTVLTTSPATDVESTQKMAKQEMPNETTITIECMKCGSETRAEAGARAYVRGPMPLSIILCSNRLSSQSEISEVLVHELVHVYDVFVRGMDLRQCQSLAYSEVRSARDAECGSSLTNFTKGLCAKEKASVATKNMFPDIGRACVCDVFEKAMSDSAPLGLNVDLNKAKLPGSERNGGGSDVGGFSSGMTFMPREARPSER